ncbi:MAG: methyltransferase domain-containing protein [Ferruginibacter sp.]|nr:methyltransferase domain-containing protein [Ferruginibacter sp.]
MINLQYRSKKKEILDNDNLPFEDIKICMKELNSINTLLGGHDITLRGMHYFSDLKNAKLTVCEIGCGGGDNLKAISKKYQNTTFIGIDLKDTCIDFAARQYPELKAEWIASDYSKVLFKTTPDIIFSSLFCHHFTNEQLVYMLEWMQKNSNKGFFINDLQRSTVAYYLIKWLTAIFSKSYLVKNDGPISVSRSFTKKDWQMLFAKAGISSYTVKWKWAFRYLVVCKK